MREIRPVSADGSGDDWPQLQAALQAPGGSVIVLKSGTYNTRTAPLALTGINGLRIVGEGKPVIRWRSTFASPGEVGSGRAGIYAEDCESLTIDGITFEGDPEPDITLNIGPAVYLRGCARPTLSSLRLNGGASLFQQDPLTEDRGLTVTGCHSYAHRVPCVPGPHTRIERSSWELPADSAWDRVGNLGSSHAIYAFAGRDHVTVDDCTFTNIRTHGVKGSGTVAPITHFRVSNSRFIDCGGGVLFGADGAADADHTDATIENNVFTDCANRGAGWFMGAAITILGSQRASVLGNQLTYTRASETPAACKGIEAQRYYTGPVGGRLCEDVNIISNEIVSSAAVAPGSVLTHAIYLFEVARARVARNRIQACASVGVTLNSGCTSASVERLSAYNVVSALQAFTATGVKVSKTRVVRGPSTSANPQIRFTTCTGIDSTDNKDMTSGAQTPLQEQTV